MALAQPLIARWRARALPEMQSGSLIQAIRDGATAPIVDVSGVRVSSAPDRRDDLPQIVHVPASLVLCDVPDYEHPMRYLR